MQGGPAGSPTTPARALLAWLVQEPLLFPRVNPRLFHQPQPLLHKKGLQPLPKPLANLWQGDVIDSGQGPPYVKVLVSLAKPVP